jgi:small subunit ribosomal protein S5
MAEPETQNTPEEQIVAPEVAAEVSAAPTEAPSASERRPARGRNDRPQQRGGGRGRGGDRRGGPRDAARSEFSQKLIGIRRVARVMAGGRRFNFSAAIVLGDKRGRVGVGLGKAADTQLAIEKATRSAKKAMISINLTKTRSIPQDVEAKFCASEVMIRPSPGRGLVAGSSVRTVLELAGVTDVTGKLLSRSHNQVNNARAAIEALRQLIVVTK